VIEATSFFWKGLKGKGKKDIAESTWLVRASECPNIIVLNEATHIIRISPGARLAGDFVGDKTSTGIRAAAGDHA